MADSHNKEIKEEKKNHVALKSCSSVNRPRFRVRRPMILDYQPSSTRSVNDDSGKLIYVKYYNKPCIYEESDDKEHDYEYMNLFMEVQPKDLIPFQSFCHLANLFSNDLPLQWKYLENSIALNKCPTKRISSEIVVVEKYKNFAIGYDFRYVRQPVVIFRNCALFYNLLTVGNSFHGKIFKLFVPQQDQRIIVLSDLYCMMDRVRPPSQNIQFTTKNVTMYKLLINVERERKSLKEYEKGRVMFCDYGSIFIPSDYGYLFDMKNTQIISSIYYHMRGLQPDLYTCWDLDETFLVFNKRRITGYFKNGIYHTVAEQKKRPIFRMDTGKKVIQYGAPLLTKPKKPVYKKVNIDCVDVDEYNCFCPEKKRTRYRKN